VPRAFHFARCEACGFVAVIDPCTDYAALYDETYYRGEGADPLVDYAHEVAHPHDTTRYYELRGVTALLRARRGDLTGLRWLDYGCGAGALVAHANRAGADCFGFDTGAFAERARAQGERILTAAELDRMAGTFDIVTMIEVIEHVVDPIALLRAVARLLRRGGLLFVTTGNAQPHAGSFLAWGYTVPEIHVSYFTPQSLARAYEAAGLTAVAGGYGPGWTDILRFRILKSLRVKERSALEAAMPWPLLARLADLRYRPSAHPLAVRR
jgi:SAM-dependent methyltransferase